MNRTLNKHVMAALLAASMGLGMQFAHADEAPAVEAKPGEGAQAEGIQPAAATPAEPVPDWALSFNLGLYSQYMFRGVALSDGPAIQGGIDLAHSSGFYVGTWTSNIDPKVSAGNHQEVDLYGGYTHTFENGFGINLLGNYYWYPDNHKVTDSNNNKRKYDSFEASIALSYANFTYTYYNILTNYYGQPNTKYAYYQELKYTHALPFGGFNFMTKVGYQNTKGLGLNQGDFAVGINRDFALPSSGKPIEGFNAGVYYTNTFNVEHEDLYDSSENRDTNQDTIWAYVKRTW